MAPFFFANHMSANRLRCSNSIPVDKAAGSSACWGVGKGKGKGKVKGERVGMYLFAGFADEEEKTKLNFASIHKSRVPPSTVSYATVSQSLARRHL